LKKFKACSNRRRLLPIENGGQVFNVDISEYQETTGCCPNRILCFDKLSMNGKVVRFQHTTVRPEPVEGQTVRSGNSPTRPILFFLMAFKPRENVRSAIGTTIQ